MAYGASATSVIVARPRQLELKDGQKLENIDVALPRTGVITGRVTDPDGEPASRVQVAAWLLRSSAEPVQTGGSSTDDQGQFRIFGLGPGDYLVLAMPSMGRGGPAEIDGDSTGFAPTYAPGTLSRAEAMRVRVTRGGQASADIRLSETRVYTISGTIVNSRGEPIQNASVMLTRADGLGGGGFGASTFTPGSFSIRNIPPGQYELVARHQPARDGAMIGPIGADGQELATVQVEVSTSNVEGIALVTRPGATVTGQVVFDSPPAEGRRVNLYTQSTERRPFMGTPSIDLKDTTFTMRNVFGPMVIRGSVPAQGWGLKAVLLRGKDITDEPTVFTESDSGHLQVVFTANAAALDGTVVDESGKPTEDAAIILFGEDPKTWMPRSSYFRTARLIKDGRFSFSGLREGRYLAVAVPLEFQVSMGQPTAELFEALSKVAIAVTLNGGERRSVDLVVARVQ
jgi:protocatechuate 3,4-dioxygenase beta subunit